MSSDHNEPRFGPRFGDEPAPVHYEPPPRRPARRRLLGAAVALTALAGFAGIAWYATSEGQRDPGAVVPVIAADAEPVKVRPLEPGGLEVPNRDMQVFGRITPDGQPQKVEQLLPPPETPMARPAAEAEPAPPAGPLAPGAPMIEERQVAPPPPVETVKTAEAEESKPAPPKQAAPAQPPSTQAPSTETPSTQAAAAPGGAWRVQLGASREEPRARAAAARLAQDNKDLLGGLAMEVVRADLGSRGVYYRMHAGPLADRAAAESLCKKLAQRKLGCMVVKP